MSTLDTSTDSPAAPSRGGGCVSATCSCRAPPALPLSERTVLVGLIAYKIVDGARLSISTFGLGFVTHVVWDPVHLQLRRGQLPLRDGGHLDRRSRSRHAARDRHRALPERARAARHPRARSPRSSRRSPRFPSVVIGLWGHPRPRPAPARPRRSGAPLGARLHPALRPGDATARTSSRRSSS